MAQDYSEWLAVNVLNEQQLISYRNLSRALKVHVNLAKQMLFDFHRKQNSKKPGSVHATYLITGKRVAQQTAAPPHENGEDNTMRSSPPLPSSSFQKPEEETEERILMKSIMMVREQHLDQAKALFESITSVHIYSLQPNALGDFQILTDCNRRVEVEYASEDPLKDWKQYGVIQNSGVKRRTRKNGPPPAHAAPAKKIEPVPAKTAAVSAKAAENLPDSKESTDEVNNARLSAPKKAGGIAASFAKGAAKPKKSDSQQTYAAASPAPAAEEDDVAMGGFSDDDGGDEDGVLPEELENINAGSGKSKKDRKAELEAMMDQEDESMDDAQSPAAEEQEEHDAGALATKPTEINADEPKETVVVENGRRRGRRRVMKKKTVKDEDGYLVTREEPVWEEFSEEEPAPKKAKIQAPAAAKAPNAKSGPAKKGQGNIMSFFGKK